MAFGGIDIGTSGCKCTLFNETGTQLAVSYRPYSVSRDRGHHEIDIMVIWDAVKSVLAEAAHRTDEPLEGISVSSFGESFVLLDEHDTPLFPVLLYTDSRGTEEASALLQDPGGYHIFEITGHRPNSTYSLPKLLWIRKHSQEAAFRVRKFVPVASCIMYFLSGESATDSSLASRTMMLDSTKGQWSDELLAIAGLKRETMPEVVDIGTAAGTVTKTLAAELGIPETVKVVAGGHDQIVAAIGAGVITPGQAVNSSGSVECITPVFSGVRHNEKLYESHFARVPMLPGLYATYATIFSGGILLQWFAGMVAGPQNAGPDIYAGLESGACEEPTGILVLPHFAGSASPCYDPDAKGAIVGLTLEHTAADIYKALQEGICYEAALNLELLAEAGISVDKLRIVGGGKNSRRWNQMKADIYGIPCVTLKMEEAGATGSAMLAGVALGIYPDLNRAAAELVKEDEVFLPRNDYTERYRTWYRKYKGLYTGVKQVMHPQAGE